MTISKRVFLSNTLMFLTYTIIVSFLTYAVTSTLIELQKEREELNIYKSFIDVGIILQNINTTTDHKVINSNVKKLNQSLGILSLGLGNDDMINLQKSIIGLSKDKDNHEKSKAHFNQAQELILKNQKTYIQEMGQIIEKEKKRLIHVLYFSFIFIIVFISSGMFISYNISKTIKEKIQIAIHHLNKISSGDLSEEITFKKDNELGMLLQALKTMQKNMKETMCKIHDVGCELQETSREVVSGNTDLSQRTEEQASSLSSTAKQIEGLASGLENTASKAQQASSLSMSAYDEAKKGSEVVKEVITSIEDIDVSTDQVAEIVSVIDDIAFQTNLLALNASVEAARAGDQGKGFAIVANEVRELAQKCANSAKEIKELIVRSINKIHKGNKLVQDSGKALGKIVKSISEVNDRVNNISNSTSKQSKNLNDIKNTLKEMDIMTQQNSALVEETAESTREIDNQANSLHTLSKKFIFEQELPSSKKEAKPAISDWKKPDNNIPVWEPKDGEW